MANTVAAPEQTHQLPPSTLQLFLHGRNETPTLVLKGRVVSLRALELMTPHTLAMLEQLAAPEMNGQVVRIEQSTPNPTDPRTRPSDLGQTTVRLVKIGVAGHVLHKAGVRR
jgi:hypothetical protein